MTQGELNRIIKADERGILENHLLSHKARSILKAHGTTSPLARSPKVELMQTQQF